MPERSNGQVSSTCGLVPSKVRILFPAFKMKGISNLDNLLKEMKPEIVGREFVFCTLSEDKLLKLDLKPILTFKEKEGITGIINKKSADKYSLN